jgi:hypothetical protein
MMQPFLRGALAVVLNLVIIIGLLAAMEFGVRAIQARRLGPKSAQPSSYMDRWAAWDSAVVAEFAVPLCDKSFGRFVPVRFVCFLLVGLFGMILHLAALGTLVKGLYLPFMKAQVIATLWPRAQADE